MKRTLTLKLPCLLNLPPLLKFRGPVFLPTQYILCCMSILPQAANTSLNNINRTVYLVDIILTKAFNLAINSLSRKPPFDGKPNNRLISDPSFSVLVNYCADSNCSCRIQAGKPRNRNLLTGRGKIFLSQNVHGARGGVVVKALCYKPAGRGFDSRWCQDFSP